MKGQTFFSVWLIFLFSLALLALGLAVSEQGMREVYGLTGTQNAVALSYIDGIWSVTIAGRTFILPTETWREFWWRLPEGMR